MPELGKIVALALLLVLYSVVFFAPVVTVQAESKTLVVPDDYASVQEAVDHAADGDTVLVKRGTYNGSVVIDKRISLIGDDKAGSVILGDWSLNGTVVLVQHDDVVVKNLALKAIRNSGYSGRGVHLLHVQHCHVLDCNFVCGVGVWLYGSSACTVERNKIDGTAVSLPNTIGIQVGYSEGNSILENTVEGYSYGYGVNFAFSSGNFLVGNQLSNNYYGILVRESENNTVTDNDVKTSMSIFVAPTDQAMRGSYGIRLQHSSNNSVADNSFSDCPKGVRIVASSDNLVENNLISGSRYVGLEVAEDSNHNQITANNIIDNGAGAEFVNSSSNHIYGNSFTNNEVTITISSTDEPNFFDNGTEGNYWSNYNGTGDTPYIIDENNQDNHPLVEPALIPEFQSWAIVPLFLTTTLLTIIAKKKFSKSNTQGFWAKHNKK